MANNLIVDVASQVQRAKVSGYWAAGNYPDYLFVQAHKRQVKGAYENKAIKDIAFWENLLGFLSNKLYSRFEVLREQYSNLFNDYVKSKKSLFTNIRLLKESGGNNRMARNMINLAKSHITQQNYPKQLSQIAEQFTFLAQRYGNLVSKSLSGQILGR